MRVYFDSGPFLDYLRFRSELVSQLRLKSRRGRSQAQISTDLEECLRKLSGTDHASFTSALTLVELEDTLQKDLRRKAKGLPLPNKSYFFLLDGRALLDYVVSVCQFHQIKIVDLQPAHIGLVLGTAEMKARKLSFRDSLHIACAVLLDCRAILTTDSGVLKVDNVFRNSKGDLVRCLDSDQLHLLL